VLDHAASASSFGGTGEIRPAVLLAACWRLRRDSRYSETERPLLVALGSVSVLGERMEGLSIGFEGLEGFEV
jgi:hypothetical protein